LASAVISVGRVGPLEGLLAHAAAVLWALAGMVVIHYEASLLTTGASLLSVALVAVALIGALCRRRPHIGVGRSSVQPGAA
jgi:hypothetical protein